MLLLLVALGCPRPITSDYEDAKVEALRRAGPAPKDWAPDAVLHLSHEALGAVVTDLLAAYGTLEDDVDASVATLHPALTVKRVDLGKGACDDCLGVTSRLEGTLGIDTAVGDTEVPLTIDALFDAEVTVDRMGGSWVLRLKPRELRDLDVKVSGMGLGYAKPTVKQWVGDNLLADVPPQEITTLGGDDLPVRAVRVVPRDRALQIHILTAVAKGRPVPVVDATPDGWRLDVSPETLAGMAAAEAYAMGPLQRDVVPVPTSLALDGDRFTLGLRLWRLSGRGWWRDNEVTGKVAVDGNQFSFQPEDARKLRSSAGAAFADPLAALGQGVILQAIEQALETTLPATHRDDTEGLRTRVATKSLTGARGVVTAEGRLIIKPVPEGAGRKGKRKRRRARRKAR